MILTDDEWIDIAISCANKDFNNDKPDGYLNAVKAIGEAAISALLEKLRGGVELPDMRDSGYSVDGIEIKTLTYPQLFAYGDARALAGRERETCTWTEQDDKDMPSTYESSCGEIWSFIDGGVKENRVTYCHHCGGKVVPASPQEQT